jgi:hypothetical protein
MYYYPIPIAELKRRIFSKSGQNRRIFSNSRENKRVVPQEKQKGRPPLRIFQVSEHAGGKSGGREKHCSRRSKSNPLAYSSSLHHYL